MRNVVVSCVSRALGLEARAEDKGTGERGEGWPKGTVPLQGRLTAVQGTLRNRCQGREKGLLGWAGEEGSRVVR